MISVEWSINLINDKKVYNNAIAHANFSYNEFINEMLNFVNKYTHTCAYIHYSNTLFRV